MKYFYLIIFVFFFSQCVDKSNGNFSLLKNSLNEVHSLSIEDLSIEGENVMIHINDSSRFVSPHYDRELIFFILKDFIRKSDSHDSLKVFIKYVNMENRKDFVMKNSVDNFSKIINMRYFSQNLVFEKCIPTLFSNKIDKEITNSFLSQYLGEIRRNNKDGFYIEDIFNFLYSYNASCSVDSDIYLDSLQLIKDKVIHGNLKSNTEFRLVEFIDLCISYCNSK